MIVRAWRLRWLLISVCLFPPVQVTFAKLVIVADLRWKRSIDLIFRDQPASFTGFIKFYMVLLQMAGSPLAN
jgi:hypothetical protein